MGVCRASPRVGLVMVVGKLVGDARGLLRKIHGMRGAKGAALWEVRVPAAGKVEYGRVEQRAERGRTDGKVFEWGERGGDVAGNEGGLVVVVVVSEERWPAPVAGDEDGEKRRGAERGRCLQTGYDTHTI